MAAGGVGLPLVTGVTSHGADQLIVSEPKAGSHWGYVAAWGPQEHASDEVGTVVFYRLDSVVGAPVKDGQTLFVQFISKTEAHYVSGARWVQEGKNVPGYQGVRDIDGFKAWLEQTRSELDAPVKIAQ